MRSRVVTQTAIIVLALAGTTAAFIVGAHAGAVLNGRVMGGSAARVLMPALGNPSPVYSHVR